MREHLRRPSGDPSWCDTLRSDFTHKGVNTRQLNEYRSQPGARGKTATHTVTADKVLARNKEREREREKDREQWVKYVWGSVQCVQAVMMSASERWNTRSSGTEKDCRDLMMDEGCSEAVFFFCISYSSAPPLLLLIISPVRPRRPPPLSSRTSRELCDMHSNSPIRYHQGNILTAATDCFPYWLCCWLSLWFFGQFSAL